MNKMVTKAVALTGAAMFAGTLVSGVGAPAKMVQAKENNSIIAGTGSTYVNTMSSKWDNGTNILIFKTDYGYGAWATDSNGIVGDAPVAKTAYYLADPYLNDGLETVYGDYVAAYEVNVATTPIGNAIQTYYDEANFAWNVTDHYDHFSNVGPLFANGLTSASAYDAKGGATTPYVVSFSFGDYSDKYVEFAATTYSPKTNAYSNDQVGLWTETKWPDFGAGLDANLYWKPTGELMYHVPEVFANPVFEDANAFATSDALYGTDNENILGQTYTGKKAVWDEEKQKVVYEAYSYTLPGQIMPPADKNGEYWGTIADYPWWTNKDGETTIGENGSIGDQFNELKAEWPEYYK